MNDCTYLKRTKIIKVITAENNGKNLNFSDLNIVTSVAIHNINIEISLNKKSLLIGGIEEFINPYL